MGSKSEKEDARRQINAPCRRGKKGKIAQKSYTVFLGIELIFSDIHAESCERKSSEYGNFIEIEHCREGRAEHSFSDELIYLSPGDLTTSAKNSKNKNSYFPLSHYHGVSVIIDLNKAPRCLTCFLDDVNVKPQIIADKFCANGKSYIARSNKSVEHIFSEIYSVPEEIKRGYFKIKVLELLLFLSCKNMPKSEEYRPTYSKSQADLAKAVCRYQTERMDEKITLAELCRRFQAAESFQIGRASCRERV